MKSSELIILVDNVEEAVKFYTEKLGFNIDDLRVSNQDHLAYARLRKSKCFIIFRKPSIEEFAEFSFIKRCVSRCVCLRIELKIGIEKYFERYNKKKLKILSELTTDDYGAQTFSLRDPFGVKLVFIQHSPEASKKIDLDFYGIKIDKKLLSKTSINDQLLNNMTATLKKFGILRRAAKKFAKLRIKKLSKSL